jgi:hypothetical protein
VPSSFVSARVAASECVIIGLERLATQHVSPCSVRLSLQSRSQDIGCGFARSYNVVHVERQSKIVEFVI